MNLAAAQLGKGRVTDYIPALAKVDPDKLGFALALPDGTIHASGDAAEPFSIQSVSKVFTLALALRRVGSALWDSVGREPSGRSAERRVGKEWVSTGRSRWSPYH